jgi:hypothetical protein
VSPKARDNPALNSILKHSLPPVHWLPLNAMRRCRHLYTDAICDAHDSDCRCNTGEFGVLNVLNVLGTANLNGYLDPVLLNGFVPTLGQTFTFLNYDSFTGEFSHIKHQVFDNGLLQWSVIYEDNHAILTVEQHVPDQGSTFLLLTLGLLGLTTFRRQLLRGQP